MSRETQGLHQAAFVLASATIGAKILALLRDRLLASNFGADKTLDVYYASFRIPDFLYVFSLFLVSATALIPLLLDKKEKSLDESRLFLNSIFSVFFFLMCFSCAAVYFLIPYLSSFVAPGFSAGDRDFLIKLSRILLFSPFLLGLSNLVSSVTQSFKRFFVYAMSGILYNVGIISGVVFFYPFLGLRGVAWGVALGALMHFSIQIPSLLHLGYFPRFTLDIRWADVKKVIYLSFPRTLGLTTNQLVTTVITSMASFLAAGSIAVFNLAINLEAIPLGVIALSYSVAAFPDLAHKFLKNEKEKFIAEVVLAARHLIFWLLPASVLFIVLRAQIVRIVLGAGAFTWADTRLTAASLALFSLSLFAEGLILLFVRAFYAAGKTRVPLFINLCSSLFVVAAAGCFLFLFKYSPECHHFLEHVLRVEGVPGTSMLILPLAYSLGNILNFLLLLWVFEKHFDNFFHLVKKSFLQVFSVSIIIGFIVYALLNLFAEIFSINTFVGIFFQGFLSGIIGLLFAIFLFRVLKNEEFGEISASFSKKLFRKKPMAPIAVEPEELP